MYSLPRLLYLFQLHSTLTWHHCIISPQQASASPPGFLLVRGFSASSTSTLTEPRKHLVASRRNVAPSLP
ncbi:hypothetical protein E4U21_002873, partial [Claviceps maximensis]